MSKQISVQPVEPKNLGLKLEANYTGYASQKPSVTISWSGDKTVTQNPNNNTQDIIAIKWDRGNQWIATSNMGEGGGGPGVYAVNHFSSDYNNEGHSFVGLSPQRDGQVTFQLLPNTSDTNPDPPKYITVMFVHPVRQFLGNWVDYVAQSAVKY